MRTTTHRAIALTDVSLVRGGQSILKATSWTVGDGEGWVVLGPNGSGKSTILRIASTYEWPTTGTVDVLGERLGRTVVADLRRRIGYTASDLERLVDHRMAVRVAVASGAQAMLVDPRSNHGAAEPDWAAVDAAVARVGLTSAGSRPLRVLSEGERRRVQIARALVAAPELLLLDEPTAGLDIGGREQLVATLASLATDRDVRAVAFVTHHVEEIPPGFSHLALVLDGTITVAGPLEEVLTSEALSDTFGLPLRLDRDGDRWNARPVT